MSDVDEESVERLRRAAAEMAERDVLDARPPGLADVIARARAMDPIALDEEAIATASRIDDVRERPIHGDNRDALAAFVAAARKLAELDVREREEDGIPARRGPVRPRWVAAAAVLFSPPRWAVVAAVVAFTPAAALVVTHVVRPQPSPVDRDTPKSQAASVVEHEDDVETAAPRRPTPPPHVPAPAELAPAPLEPVPPSAVEGSTNRSGPEGHEDQSRRPSSDAQLRELADEAEAALVRGELARADELLTRLIAIGGRHRLVELAYGDRFTIAHRSGIIAEQTKLWRAYLGKFPRGRFADDARAGLCRHAKADTAVDCWQEYLADLPKGAYRGLAQRAIEEADGP